MAAQDNLGRQFTLYHGTHANVEEGDYIHPVSEESPLFSSTDKETAGNYGTHLYEVKPTEEWDLWHSESFKDPKTGDEHHNYATAWPYEVVKKFR